MKMVNMPCRMVGDMGATPSLRTFRPRPVGLAGRWTTWIDSMRCGTWVFAAASARSDAMLKSSAPQNRMRRGSGRRCGAAVELCRRKLDAIKERTEAGSPQSMLRRAGRRGRKTLKLNLDLRGTNSR